MKTFYSFRLTLKIIFLVATVLCLNTLLQAQNLYVQPIGAGEQVSFELAQKPKITFSSRSMVIETSTGREVFALNEIQNLSFVEQNGSNDIAIIEGDRIRLYPNPVKDELELNIQIPTQGLTYRIYDMSGALIKTEEIVSAITRINVENFRTGVYIFKLDQNGKELQSFKIVKQ